MTSRIHCLLRGHPLFHTSPTHHGIVHESSYTLRFTFIGPAAYRRNHTPPAEPTPGV